MPVAQLIAKSHLIHCLRNAWPPRSRLVPVLSVAGLFLLCVAFRNLSAPKVSKSWVGLSSSR